MPRTTPRHRSQNPLVKGSLVTLSTMSEPVKELLLPGGFVGRPRPVIKDELRTPSPSPREAKVTIAEPDSSDLPVVEEKSEEEHPVIRKAKVKIQVRKAASMAVKYDDMNASEDDPERIKQKKVERQVCKDRGEQKFFVALQYAELQSRTPEEWEEMGDHETAERVRLLAERKAAAKAAKEAEKARDWIYLTWNPSPECNTLATHQALIKFLLRKGNEKYIYSVEHFTDHGERTHYHVLIRFDSSHQNHQPTRFKNNAYASFKNFCQCNPHTVNIKYIKQANVMGIYRYIMGQKEADKMSNVQQDREWRAEQGLSQVYMSEDFELN